MTQLEQYLIDKYEDALAIHIGELEDEGEYKDAKWFEDRFPHIKSVECTDSRSFTLVLDRKFRKDDIESICDFAFGFRYDWDDIIVSTSISSGRITLKYDAFNVVSLVNVLNNLNK